MNCAVRDWSADFRFIVGAHCCRCVSEIDLIDNRLVEIGISVEDSDKLLGAVLEAARGGGIAVDSACRSLSTGSVLFHSLGKNCFLSEDVINNCI
jgi:hypothetical protein